MDGADDAPPFPGGDPSLADLEIEELKSMQYEVTADLLQTQERLSALNQDLSDARDRIAELESASHESISAERDLRDEVARLLAHNAALEEHVADVTSAHEREVASLRAETESHIASLEAQHTILFESFTAEHSSEAEKLQEALADATQRHNALRQDHKELSSKHDTLLVDYSALADELTTLSTQYSDLAERFESVCEERDRIRPAAKRLPHVENDLAAAQEQLKLARLRLETAEAEDGAVHSSLQGTLRCVRKELSDLREEARMEARRAADEIRATTDRLNSEREAEVSELNLRIQSLSRELVSVSSERDDLVQSRSESQSILLQLRERLAALTADVRAGDTQLARLFSRHKDLTAGVREYTAELSGSATSLHRLTERVLTQAGSALEAGVRGMKEEHTEARRLLEASAARVAALRSDLEAERARGATLEADLRARWEGDRTALLEHLADMEAAAEKRISDIADRLSDLKAENDALTRENERARTEMSRLGGLVAQTRSQTSKEVSAIRKRYDETALKLKEKSEQVTQLKRTQKLQSSETTAGQRALNELRAQQAAARTALAANTKRLDELMKKYQRMSKELAEERRAFAQAAGAASSTQTQLSAEVQHSLKEHSKEVETTQREARAVAEAARVAAEERVAGIERERDDALRRLREEQARADALAVQNEQLLSRPERTADDDAHMAELESENARMLAAVESTRMELNERAESSSQLKADVESAQRELLEMAEQLESSSTAIEELRREMSHQKDSDGAEIAELSQRLQQMRSVFGNSAAAASADRDRVAELSALADRRAEELSSAQKDNGVLKDQLSSLHEQLEAAQGELRVARAQAQATAAHASASVARQEQQSSFRSNVAQHTRALTDRKTDVGRASISNLRDALGPDSSAAPLPPKPTDSAGPAPDSLTKTPSLSAARAASQPLAPAPTSSLSSTKLAALVQQRSSRPAPAAGAARAATSKADLLAAVTARRNSRL
jgi:chromosome segregation ATPase